LILIVFLFNFQQYLTRKHSAEESTTAKDTVRRLFCQDGCWLEWMLVSNEEMFSFADLCGIGTGGVKGATQLGTCERWIESERLQRENSNKGATMKANAFAYLKLLAFIRHFLLNEPQ
jgi:hypothetical protein